MDSILVREPLRVGVTVSETLLAQPDAHARQQTVEDQCLKGLVGCGPPGLTAWPRCVKAFCSYLSLLLLLLLFLLEQFLQR